MQEFCCFIAFLCQYIHYFTFPEMAERGGGLQPPPKSATGLLIGTYIHNPASTVLPKFSGVKFFVDFVDFKVPVKILALKVFSCCTIQ